MYVVDETPLSTQVKRVLESNPFRKQINDLNYKADELLSNIDNNNGNILDLESRVEREKISLNVNTQKLRKGNIQINHLTKMMNASSQDFNCNFLKLPVIEAFFNAQGMKFIALSIKQDGTAATLSYVRQSKLIGNLPIPPMVINLNYQINLGELAIKKVTVQHNMSTACNTHPHITSARQNGSVCLGNFFDVLKDNSGSVLLEGYQDQVLLVDTLLSTYNPDSPYQDISQILSNTTSNINFDNEINIAIENYSTYTFLGTKIERVSEHKVSSLIGREMGQEYLDSVSRITQYDLLSNVIDELGMMNFNGEDSDLSAMRDMRSSIYAIIGNESGVNLQELDESYDEDNDSYYLDECNFDDCKDEWRVEVLGYMEGIKEKGLTVKGRIPNLDNYYEEVSNVSI